MERQFHQAEELESKARIGDFWLRIAAWLADNTLLGLFFTYGVTPFFGRYAPEGTLLQLVLALGYFAICDSRWTGGSSFGKMMMGLSVVDRRGNFISPLRALWRASIGSLPTLIAASLASQAPIPEQTKLLIYAAGAGLSLASAWLYIFNPQSRQIVHDLLAGTFVVKYESGELPVEGRTKKYHVGLAAIVFGAAALGLPLAAPYWDAQFPAENPCTAPVRTAVEALPFVDHINVYHLANGQESGFNTSMVAVYVRRGDTDHQAALVADRILAACPLPTGETDFLAVDVTPRPSGYSLSGTSYTYAGSTAEWRSHRGVRVTVRGRDERPNKR